MNWVENHLNDEELKRVNDAEVKLITYTSLRRYRTYMSSFTALGVPMLTMLVIKSSVQG